jgi:branched-chain amino acid transport system substrate-binding protein
MVARLLAALFALGVGCGAARGAEPITIGFGMALTGGLAVNGKAALIAMKIWEEDVNAKGGLLGRPVKLVYYDDQSTPPNVPGIYTKLLDVDKVDLVVSGYGTNVTVPAMPVVMEHNKTFVTLFALAVNAEFNYPRYFGMIPAGPVAHAKEAFSRGFFDAVQTMQPRPQTIAMVGADAEASRNAMEGAQANARAAGLKIVYDRSYPPTTTDFSPVVRAIQAVHADVVYIASYPQDSVGLVNALHEIGLKARLVGGSMVGLQTTSIKTQLGPKLNGLVTYEFWLPAPALQFPGIMAFLDRYQARAAQEGVDALGYYIPPFAYAYLQVLGEAVEGSGGLDQGKLAEYIHSHTFQTIVGDLAFGPDGDWTQDRILAVQFHDVKSGDVGQFRGAATETVLAPAAFRTGGVVEPYSDIAH